MDSRIEMEVSWLYAAAVKRSCIFNRIVHAFSGGEETAISSQAHEPRSESGLPDFDQATFAKLMVFIIH